MNYTTVIESVSKVWVVVHDTADDQVNWNAAFELCSNFFDRKQCHRAIMINENGLYVSIWSRA